MHPVAMSALRRAPCSRGVGEHGGSVPTVNVNHEFSRRRRGATGDGGAGDGGGLFGRLNGLFPGKG